MPTDRTDDLTEVGWVAVAELLRPQGRRGEVLAEPLTDQQGIFQIGRQLRLAVAPATAAAMKPAPLDAATSGSAVTLEGCWRPQGRNARRVVVKLAGVDSISAAEALNGGRLLLAEADLPPLEPGTFFVRQLIGCAVFDDADRTEPKEVGTVVDLQFPVGPDGRSRLAEAADILVVQRIGMPESAEPALIPFVKQWLRSVDVVAKRIVLSLPPGLLDEVHAL